MTQDYSTFSNGGHFVLLDFFKLSKNAKKWSRNVNATFFGKKRKMHNSKSLSEYGCQGNFPFDEQPHVTPNFGQT